VGTDYKIVHLSVILISVNDDKVVAFICFCYYELVFVYFVLYSLGCCIRDVLVWSKLWCVGSCGNAKLELVRVCLMMT
jgi:hypothetical protein